MDAEGEGSYDATCGPERTGRVVAAGIERIDSPPAPTPLPVVNGGGADVREGRMVRGVMEVVRRVDRSELVDVPVADVDVDVVLSVKKSEPVAVEVSVSVLEVVVALPSLVEVLVVVVSVAAVSVVPVVTDAPHAPVVVVVVVVDFLSASVDVPVLVVDLSDVDDLLDVESSAGDLVATTVEVPGSGAIPVAPAGEPSETECGLGITSGGGVLMIDVVCGASVAGPSPLGDAPGVVVWPPGVVAGVEMSRGVDVGGVMADDGVSPGIGSSAPAGVVAPMRVGAVMSREDVGDGGGFRRNITLKGTLRNLRTFGLSQCRGLD
ncbi:hypothetical protein HK101_008610 [Irineochytrium annulatum]|nr:hypothetical protein HK101_008610 [Irineochytrium annulatum]